MQEVRADIRVVDFRAKRQAAGLTLEQAGEKLGVSLNYVHRIESGDRTMSLPLALRAAQLFGDLHITMGAERFLLRANGTLAPDRRPDDDGGGQSARPTAWGHTDARARETQQADAFGDEGPDVSNLLDYLAWGIARRMRSSREAA